MNKYKPKFNYYIRLGVQIIAFNKTSNGFIFNDIIAKKRFKSVLEYIDNDIVTYGVYNISNVKYTAQINQIIDSDEKYEYYKTKYNFSTDLRYITNNNIPFIWDLVQLCNYNNIDIVTFGVFNKFKHGFLI